MLRRLSRRFVLTGSLTLFGLTGVGMAEEPFDDFLQGLRERQHGELAIHYLNMIKDRPDLPEDLKVAFDLEMARSLQIAAIRTPNTDLQAKYVLDAQAALDKFLKEHADHPEAGSAQMTSGEISLFRAQNILKTAMRDKTKRDILLPEARKLLEEARPKFVKASEMFKVRVDEVRAENTGKKKTLSKRAARAAAEATNMWYDARFKVATVDYNIGLSYPEPKDPKRKDFLAKAAKGFDGIYQENRSGRSGVYAHMWEGRSREEMEDLVTAMDIYDEVMSASPDKNVNLKTEAQWVAMFNEVNRYRLMLLGRMKQYDKLIDDAKLWLSQNEAKKKTSGYQGIKLELAKGLLEYAKTAKGADAEDAVKDAKKRLGELAATPSEFQKEAILLLRFQGGGNTELNTFEDAIAVGDAAAKAAGEATTPADAKTNWTEAEKAYTKAIELSADVKDKDRVLGTRFMLAYTQLYVGKAPEAYTTALTLAKENPTFAKAPAAAALAVSTAMSLYGQTRDNAALEKINEASEFLLQKFPQHAEADDARIARGKLKLLQGGPDEAIKVFMTVNTISERYPAALQLSGQTHWLQYIDGKKKGDTGKADATQAHRTQAIDLLTKSLDAAVKSKTAGSPQMQQTIHETRLLLAEIRLEEEKPAEALPLLQPLVDDLKAKPAGPLDKASLRILIAALQTYSALSDSAKAIEVGQLLLANGEDHPQVNGVLMQYARIIRNDWKRTEGELFAANESKDEGRINNAKLAQTAGREAMIKLVDEMSKRKNFDLAGMVFLAENDSELGRSDKSREQFQAILDRAAADPAFAKQAAKAMIRIRSQFIGLLRADGKYEEALKQVEALLKEQPNALEPMMEKGNILQALAEKDPKRYDEAAMWWTGIRKKLDNAPKTPKASKKPKEYYEIVYNTAVCLMAQKDPEKSKQAAQILNGTLALSPNLDDPERVEKYKVLIKQLGGAAKAPAAASKLKAAEKKS